MKVKSMAFCIQCGASIPDGSRFCSQCGAAQEAAATPVMTIPQPAATPVMTIPQPVMVQPVSYDPADDSVMLVSLGTCDVVTATLLLQRTCGYNEADARLIALSTPITLAKNLTDTQSTVLAQALAEYGMEVTVFDGTGYRNVTPKYETVYNTSGGFLESVASVLGLIGVSNRIARNAIRRSTYPHHFYGVRPPVMSIPRRYASARPTVRPIVPPTSRYVNAKVPHAVSKPGPVRGVGPAPKPMAPAPMAPLGQRPMGGNRGGDAKVMGAITPKGPGRR